MIEDKLEDRNSWPKVNIYVEASGVVSMVTSDTPVNIMVKQSNYPDISDELFKDETWGVYYAIG